MKNPIEKFMQKPKVRRTRKKMEKIGKKASKHFDKKGNLIIYQKKFTGFNEL